MFFMKKIKELENDITALYKRVYKLECNHDKWEYLTKYDSSGYRCKIGEYLYFKKCIQCGLENEISKEEYVNSLIKQYELIIKRLKFDGKDMSKKKEIAK